MSFEYKYSLLDFPDKEALRAFIDDEMNRPDSMDELISVLLQADGTYLAVIKSRKQVRSSERFERNVVFQREHERFQGGSNYDEPRRNYRGYDNRPPQDRYYREQRERRHYEGRPNERGYDNRPPAPRDVAAPPKDSGTNNNEPTT